MLTPEDILADKIEKLLIINKMNHMDLARASNVNVSVIRSILKKRTWPGLDNIRKLAKALGAEQVDLFNPQELPHPVVVRVSPKEALEIIREAIETPKPASTKIPERCLKRLEQVPEDLWDAVMAVVDGLVGPEPTPPTPSRALRPEPKQK